MTELLLEKIIPDTNQPRKDFDENELQKLANSIIEHGVILPIAVEEIGNGFYMIQDGERRWRASKIDGLKKIPAIIHPATNGDGAERFVRSMVANLQRIDLDPIEEAKGYKQLHDLGISKNKIAIKLGISAARVAQKMKLLELDENVQELMRNGNLSSDSRLVGALLDLPDKEIQIQMANKLVQRKSSIHAGIKACKELINHIHDKKSFQSKIPAIDIAIKEKGEINRLKWDALAEVGKIPPWILLELCIRDTCQICDVRDMASHVICNACPLVELLKKMIGKVNNE
ncbi:ParB/RepB/Spo0J family partition protein [candidate division KSB1 bacterium]|nr:ParB/RepB/Spo0J family partition protein [candidate division KSB1 bacterium]